MLSDQNDLTLGNIPGPFLLYDGVCLFCNQIVKMILKWEKVPQIFFSPVQSEFAQNLIKNTCNCSLSKDAVIYIENGYCYSAHEAFLQIAKRLKWPLNYLKILGLLPDFLLSRCYRLIARHRYSWFGKSENCIIPDESIRYRFILK